jgi:hypothetical protein
MSVSVTGEYFPQGITRKKKRNDEEHPETLSLPLQLFLPDAMASLTAKRPSHFDRRDSVLLPDERKLYAQ